MRPLLRREFVVDVPRRAAWDHLARVEDWPSWAGHIERVELTPPGVVTATSRGVFRLSNGIRSTFAMSEFAPPDHWAWIGPILWLRLRYDHRFESLDGERTRLIWTLGGEGAGVGSVGRLVAAIYNRNLDRAIPRLVAEMAALRADMT